MSMTSVLGGILVRSSRDIVMSPGAGSTSCTVLVEERELILGGRIFGVGIVRRNVKVSVISGRGQSKPNRI